MSKTFSYPRNLIAAIATLGTLTAIVAPAFAADGVPETTAVSASESLNVSPPVDPVISGDQVAQATSDDDVSVDLPDAVETAVFQDITNQSGAVTSDLRVLEARQETWSNGCLGLSQPDTICTMATVPGWLVTVTDGLQYWVYRTNESGSVVAFDRTASETRVAQAESSSQSESRTETSIERRTTVTTETQSTTQSGTVALEGQSQTTVVTQQTAFSQTVQTAVFQAIAQQSQVQVSELRVLEARQVTWANGCLGLPGNGSCTQAEVPGWVVVVSRGQQLWVYRTNLNGSVVAYDAVATETRIAQLRGRQETRVFSDVQTGYWANPFIVELAKLDIIAGYPDGTYRPEQAVTRAELAAIIRRAFEVTEVRQAVRFTDVSTTYWAYSAIEEAYEMGFLSTVSSNAFRPQASLTRADVLFALARGLKISTQTSPETLLSAYDDVQISSDTRLLLAALTEQGIVVNYPNVRLLTLERVATRAEVAAFIYQTLVSLGRVEAISSSYVVPGQATVINNGTAVQTDSRESAGRRNCNQGIGNGAEGCDPGNSAPRGGSNDEGGRTPGRSQ
ncbi:S-layer homology domain-containing protein [Oscillatoria sp. FACHB-1407]|uniref:S-layer homology domain-containing protein n=1 Tax=Oscillatoria sp. FACHB-1407 TaxID=2692847 RepID=UPI0016866D9A|nr:S-layer homology domain-containing protein [Oscillatoria sp. FACHB-1407]MBD2465694.1 S-layer homology domain-containing protein [Oscillatoria sp. FACHB-1407]